MDEDSRSDVPGLCCVLLLLFFFAMLPYHDQHALQASKTDDAELKDSIRKAKSAIEAKKIARAIKVILLSNQLFYWGEVVGRGR